MCRTGGPRCYSHASKTAVKAEAAYRAAADELERCVEGMQSSADTAAWKAAFQAKQAAQTAWDDALADMAASPMGAARLRERMQSAGPDHLDEADVYRALPDTDDLNGIVGKTGDPLTDKIVAGAVRQVAEHPEQHPGWEHILPAPSPYPDEAAKNTMITAWRRSVTAKAEEVMRRQRRVVEATQDTWAAEHTVRCHPNDTDARRRFAQARQGIPRRRGGRLRKPQPVTYPHQDHARRAPDGVRAGPKACLTPREDRR